MGFQSALSKAGDAFGSIKDKVGSVGGRKDRYNYDDFDEFESYDSYREDYVDPIYDDEERYLPLDSFSSYRNSSSDLLNRRDAYNDNKSNGRASSSYNSPSLVSREDVRDSVRLPASLERNPLPERRVTRPGRTMVDANLNEGSAEYSSYQQGGTSSMSSSSAYESSFAVPSSSSSSRYSTFSPSSVSSDLSSYRTQRSIKILKPMRYEEGQEIAHSLKAGNAVVLITSALSGDLTKRVLDFAFGVSCALEASVDCMSSQVYVFTRSYDLTDQEKEELRMKGIL